MAANQTPKICDIDPEVKSAARKFRLRKEKTNGALILKIDASKQLVFVDELYEDISIEDLKEELPSHLPIYSNPVKSLPNGFKLSRVINDTTSLISIYILYSYCLKHDDGRVSYPLCFIFVSPPGCKPDLHIMYAGSKLHVVKEVEATKVFELRSFEELTEEWLISKLAFFR